MVVVEGCGDRVYEGGDQHLWRGRRRWQWKVVGIVSMRAVTNTCGEGDGGGSGRLWGSCL